MILVKLPYRWRPRLCRLGTCAFSLVLILASTSCGLFGPPSDAKQLLRELEHMESALSVGITYREFGTRLVELKSQYDRLERNHPKFISSEESTATHLKAAMSAYLELNSLWRHDLDAKRGYAGINHYILGLATRYPVVNEILLEWDSKPESQKLHSMAETVSRMVDAMMMVASRETRRARAAFNRE
jgi:hypothetical protein